MCVETELQMALNHLLLHKKVIGKQLHDRVHARLAERLTNGRGCGTI